MHLEPFVRRAWKIFLFLIKYSHLVKLVICEFYVVAVFKIYIVTIEGRSVERKQNYSECPFLVVLHCV